MAKVIEGFGQNHPENPRIGGDERFHQLRVVEDVGRGGCTRARITGGAAVVADVQTPAIGTLRIRFIGTLRIPFIAAFRTPAIGTLRIPFIAAVQAPFIGTLQTPTVGGVRTPVHDGKLIHAGQDSRVHPGLPRFLPRNPEPHIPRFEERPCREALRVPLAEVLDQHEEGSTRMEVARIVLVRELSVPEAHRRTVSLRGKQGVYPRLCQGASHPVIHAHRAEAGDGSVQWTTPFRG